MIWVFSSEVPFLNSTGAITDIVRSFLELFPGFPSKLFPFSDSRITFSGDCPGILCVPFEISLLVAPGGCGRDFSRRNPAEISKKSY